MRLYKEKYNGKGFHLDIKLPPKVSIEKVFQIIADFYDEPNKQTEFRLQVSQLRRVMLSVQYYAVWNPHKVQDMFQAACLGLLESIQKLKKSPRKEPNHVLNYMRRYVHGHIRKHLRRDHVIYGAGFRKLKQVDYEGSVTEDFDLVLEACRNEQERKILTLLSHGYTEREISDDTGMTRYRIRATIQRIRRTFE